MKRGPVYLTVLLAALLPQLGALTCGFALDDFGLIVHNRAVRFFDLPFLFTQDYWAGFGGRVSGLYRPLTLLSFAVEFRAWGESPSLFHLTNLMLHAGCALLVCALAGRLVGRRFGLLAGLLFAVHPVHVEAVVGIAGRADLLSSLFVLAGLLASIAFRAGDRRWRLASPLFLGLGLLCKEQAVVLPGLLLGVDWFLKRQGRLSRWPWSEYAAHLLVMGAYLLVRRAVLGGLAIPEIDFLDNPLAAMPVPLRLVNAAAILGRYLFLLVFPCRLSADYSYDAVPLTGSLLSPELAWSALLLLAAVSLLLYRFHRAPAPWSLGAAWLLAGLAPVANLVLPIGTLMAERLLYLPSVGFVLMLAELLQGLRGAAGKRTWPAICAALLLAHAGRAWTRSADWRDDESLFRAAVEAYPRSAKAHQGLGSALQARGDLIGALEAYERAIAIHPRYEAAHYNLGLIYYRLQQYDRALNSFREAVRLDPDNPRALLNLGATYYALGKTAEAEAAYRRTLAISPAYAPAWENLGDTYWEMGEREKAATAYRELLRLRPDHPRREEYEARIRAGDSAP